METEDNISYYADSAKHVDFANHRGSAKYSSVLFFYFAKLSTLIWIFCSSFAFL